MVPSRKRQKTLKNGKGLIRKLLEMGEFAQSYPQASLSLYIGANREKARYDYFRVAMRKLTDNLVLLVISGINCDLLVLLVFLLENFSLKTPFPWGFSAF
jgi:hypothetical protein